MLIIVVCCSPEFYEFMKCKLHLYTEVDPLLTYRHSGSRISGNRVGFSEEGWFSDNHRLAVHHISVRAEVYQEKMRKIERQLAR